MFNKKDKKSEALENVEEKLQAGEITTPEQYFEAIKTEEAKIESTPNPIESVNYRTGDEKELVEVLAKALQDASELLPPGGSVRTTVNKALAKYNASK